MPAVNNKWGGEELAAATSDVTYTWVESGRHLMEINVHPDAADLKVKLLPDIGGSYNEVTVKSGTNKTFIARCTGFTINRTGSTSVNISWSRVEFTR